LIGQTLSHYRVTANLGAGGMGEVYRATDTKLGRDVAIKVLPPEVVQDPERLGRFKREAQLLAALNHTNIAAIYGLEEVEGKPFLALELVEGEDLKERLARGAIPLDEALEIAEQIAEALEEAHNKGIVHRDLKPANIKITPEGQVKILDFGLAKALEDPVPGPESRVPSLSHSPTLTQQSTQAGVILGTAAYMSPEQAVGERDLDARSDVYALGLTLYELFTGSPAFAADSLGELRRMHAEIRPTPPSTRIAGFDREIEAAILACLEKDPADRPASAARLLESLEHLPDVPEWTQAEALARWEERAARCDLPEPSARSVDKGVG